MLLEPEPMLPEPESLLTFDSGVKVNANPDLFEGFDHQMVCNT